jgi:D-alanyl-D-alanine carboxypeptidase (penicillin-binding protein 5/6)
MDRRLIVPIVLLLAAASRAGAVSGEYRAAVVMDARTREVLFAENEHQPLPPASMVKMMTELIILELIAEGELSAEDAVLVSARASRMGGSQVYLKQGETFTVHELLKALTIHSANDAAVALAEHAGGSADAFVELMNRRAQELGMHDTVFHFVHGLPPASDQDSDFSSAYDMALLGLELTKHPEAMAWAVMDGVPFRDGEFTLVNPNPLVGEYRGLEGIKTGYTAAAGFCLTAAATQKGVRLISVVMGSPTNKARGMETTRLLTRGFADYTRVSLVEENALACPETVKVKGGKVKVAALLFAEPLAVGIRKDQDGLVTLRYELPDGVEAPAAAGTVVGRAVAMLGDLEYGSVELKLAVDVQKGGFWDRLLRR